MTCCRRTRNECLCQCQTVACISPVCLFLIMSSLLLLFCFVRCLCRLEPALSGDKAMQGMPGVQDVQGAQGMPRCGTGPGTVKTWKQQTMDSACRLHG